MFKNKNFPKKKFGQNFLVDKNILSKIISQVELKESDYVLEIGPGRGELTRMIVKKTKHLWAVELDRSLCRSLKEDLKSYANVTILNRNILEYQIVEELKSIKKPLKVIGNIPYYISSKIIQHLMENRQIIECVYITVQKEYGEKIVSLANSGSYGALSCFVQYFAEPKILFFIKNKSFWPAPKVDSCFLRLKIRRVAPVKVKDEDLFFKIVRAAFSKRRKTLRNSLWGIVSEKKLKRFFQEFNIDPKIRPQSLTLQNFASLANL